jgi:outer membrane protein assembly factor BamB
MYGRKAVGRAAATVVWLLAFGMWTAAPASSSAPPASPLRTTGPQVDFPAYMHDAGHSAFSPSATTISPTSSLSVKSIFRATKSPGQPSPGFVGTPLVLQHVIYIGSNSGDFYAISLGTHKVIWKKFLGYSPAFECANSRGFSAAAVSGIDPTTGVLTVYAPSGDGNLYALRASDGAILWTSPVNVPTAGMNDYFNWSNPELANGKIYIGVSSDCDDPLIRGGLVALDQATGQRVATYYTVPAGQVGGSIWSSPAVAGDGSILVDTGNGMNGARIGDTQSIVRLDPNTLQRLDGYQIVTKGGDSDFGGSPTVFTATINGVSTPMVGACNKNGFYYAWKLTALSAGPVWQVEIAPHRHANGICVSGAIWDGSHLYLGGTATMINGVSYRGSIRQLDPATGAAVWLTGLPAAIMTSPSLDGAGAIAATSYDGEASVTNSAFLVDAATGSYVTIDDGEKRAAPSPVFADQYLVIATSAGHIYTYETE